MFRKYRFLFFLFLFLTTLLLMEEIYFLGNSLPYSKELIVKKGDGLELIADNLKKSGAVRSKWLFFFYVLLRGKSGDLKAGVYFIDPGETIDLISKKIILGNTIKERIIIPEGWGILKIAQLLEEKGVCKKESFLAVTGCLGKAPGKDFSQEFSFLKSKPSSASLEGFLFPDTYVFERGENPEDVVRVMLDNFGKKLTPGLKKEISQQNKTIFEVINMASLIEKEANDLEDKKIISGILWKRLRHHMPLQVDATICYVNGGNCYRPSGEDLRIDSFFNTYRYQGLPPTPICNPGLDSIISAIYPEDSNYWYYLSTPAGKIIFSRTLKEHNINKYKYLK